MNEAHIHLVVNHLPIIFPVVGVIVLITGFVFKSNVVKRTAFMIFMLGALTAIFAMKSGEGAEDVVEKINGISKEMIETHEESAEVFAVLAYVLGGLSLIGLWANVKQKPFSQISSIIVFVFAIVVLFFAKQAGTTGGEIRHTEIRSGYTIESTTTTNSEKDHRNE